MMLTLISKMLGMGVSSKITVRRINRVSLGLAIGSTYPAKWLDDKYDGDEFYKDIKT